MQAQFLAGAVVLALAGAAGKVSPVSKVCQDSRSRVSASKHVGKHTDGVAGWRAQVGSGGICTLRTGSACCAGGCVTQPARLHSSTITSAVEIDTKGGDFLGVSVLRMAQFLFCLAAGLLGFGAQALGRGHQLGVLGLGGLVRQALGLQAVVRGAVGQDGAHQRGAQQVGQQGSHHCAPMHLAWWARRRCHRPQQIVLPGSEHTCLPTRFHSKMASHAPA